MKIFKKEHVSYLLGIVIFILSSILVSFNFALIVLSIYVLDRYVIRRIPTLNRESIFFRTLVAFLVYCAYVLFVISFSWLLLGHNFSLSFIPILGLFLLLPSLFISRKSTPSITRNLSKRKLIEPKDLAAGAFALVVLLSLIYTSITGSGGVEYKSSVISLASGNVDDAAHLSILNDRIDFDRATTHHSDAAPKTRTSSMYPVSWHSLNAILIESIAPTITSGAESLVAYVITKLFWVGILIFLALRLTLQLVSHIQAKRSHRIVLGLSAMAIAGYFCLFYVQIFMFGFYSFIPQILFIILGVSLLYYLTDKKSEKDTSLILMLASLTILGGCMSWFLPLPPIVVALGAIYIFHSLRQTVQQTLRRFFQIVMAWAPFYTLVATGTLVQIFVVVNDGSEGSVSFQDGILLEGGISAYSPLYLMIASACFALYIIFSSRKRESSSISFAIRSILYSLILFSAIIYFIQQFTVFKNAYYFYKTLYIVIGVSIPFVITGAVYLVAKFSPKIGAAPLILVCGLFFTLGIEPSTKQSPMPFSAYLAGERALSTTQNELVFKSLQHASSISHYYEPTQYFFYEPGLVDRNEISTLLIKANKKSTPCFEKARSAFLSGGSFSDQAREINNKCGTSPVVVYTSNELAPEFKTTANDYDNITVLSYDKALSEY